MNRFKNFLLEAISVKRVVLLTLFVAASASAQTTFQRHVEPPPVPEDLQIGRGFVAFLVGHAVGTQNYVCRPSGSGFAFVLFTPQATLFMDNDKQIITHFFSPNPSEPNTDPKVVTPALGTPGMIRATWQDSQDSSTVWARTVPKGSFTPNSDAIAWLKLEVVGAQDGPTGDNTLTQTKFVQRLNTTGGKAPSSGCTSVEDVGNEAFVPYTADYFLYKKASQ